ncbi:MAG: 50S ribosomal protein L25/general stress protein Ctc [Lautropia sp. SCN 69-89]|nr:MAG: 50S ribosomal protein L25/general stress protein Ctc [Lautropia sp. SCN 69-89]
MKVVAKTRKEQGSGASRRLRRAGLVPGIVYGGKGAATPVSIEHNPLYHSLRVEAFHSSILDMDLDGARERVLLRDVQWHAYKPQVVHIDFQRVAADEKITVKVPLHFVNQEISPAVKLSAGIVGHVVNEVEISCLPDDLPSFIEVDLANLEAGKAVHFSEIAFPKGVTPVAHAGDDPVIVTVTIPGAAEEEPAAPAAASAPAAAPAAKK